MPIPLCRCPLAGLQAGSSLCPGSNYIAVTAPGLPSPSLLGSEEGICPPPPLQVGTLSACPCWWSTTVLGQGEAALELWCEGGMGGRPSVLHQHTACQSPAALQQTGETSSRASACWGTAGDTSSHKGLLAGPKNGSVQLVIPPAPWLPLAPSGSSALKTSALSFLLKSTRFQGGEWQLKLSPPALTAREVHISAGVVEVFLCTSLRSGSGDSSGSAGTLRWQGDTESGEGQHGRAVWDGAEQHRGCSLPGPSGGMRHTFP